jgi:uncharacterized SAM-binding protein YcdF (DUF218 family)
LFIWKDCAQPPLAGLEARELLLHLLFTPALLLPLVAGGWVFLAWALRWRSPAVLALAVSTIYSPTTAAAAHHLSRQPESVVYVSGDQPITAERLLTLGVPPARIAGDSCARTTWENATHTAPWLQQHHPGAPVLLITDPWQLARATAAFRHQNLQVIPLAVTPALTSAQSNRLALRETAATLLYRLQGRM